MLRQFFGQVEVSSHIDSLKLVISRCSESNFLHSVNNVFHEEGYSLSLFARIVQIYDLLTGSVWSSEFNDNLGSELMCFKVL